MPRKQMALAGLGGGAERWAAPLFMAMLDDESLKIPARPGALGELGGMDSMQGKAWPESHTAHTHLSVFFNRHGLTSKTLNLANGKTNDVPAEIIAVKAWWQKYGSAFLEGGKVPNPKLTSVWFIS